MNFFLLLVLLWGGVILIGLTAGLLACTQKNWAPILFAAVMLTFGVSTILSSAAPGGGAPLDSIAVYLAVNSFWAIVIAAPVFPAYHLAQKIKSTRRN